MEKVQVMLEVPSISGQYEILVPKDLQIKEIISLMIDAIGELSGGLYSSSGTEVLCARLQNIMLGENRKLKDYNIGNGEHLILI